MFFYRNLVTVALELTPSQPMRAITEEVVGFEMPGSVIPGFSRKAVQMTTSFPLLRQRGVWKLSDLDADADGESGRDELAAAVSALDIEATKFVERRDEAAANKDGATASLTP
jgi:acyl-[acyl-carrier-protein] desaturase